MLERWEDDRYLVGRTVFGAEPSNAQLREFLLHGLSRLELLEASGSAVTPRPPRPRRQARGTRPSVPTGTRAQEAFKAALNVREKQRHREERARREQLREERFRRRVESRKRRRKGR